MRPWQLGLLVALLTCVPRALPENFSGEGKGVYRPFNWLREVKLATSFVVDPNLPQTARVYHAYLLQDVLDELGIERAVVGLREGSLHLSVQVDDGTRYLTVIPNPCSGDGREAEASAAASECETRVRALVNETENASPPIQVFSSEQLLIDRGDRVVTWDPDEMVALATHLRIP